MRDNKFKTVIDAAYKVIDKYNFEGANISRITREARVSSGIIYRNFGTKENFYKFLYYEALADFIEFIDLNDFNNSDVPGRVKIMTCAVFEFTKVFPEKTMFIEKYREANKEIMYSDDITRDILKELRLDVKIWIQNGKFINIPINSMYAILTGSMIKLALNPAEHEKLESFEVEKIVSKMVDNFLPKN